MLRSTEYIGRAIQVNHVEFIKLWLADPTVHVIKTKVVDALYSAARLGHTDICQLIIDTRLLDSTYICNALILACTCGHLLLAQLLIKHCKYDVKQVANALVSIATNGHIDVGKWLTFELLPLALDQKSRWVLAIVSGFGTRDTFKELTDDFTTLTQSANGNEGNNQALRVACWNGRVEVADWLLKNTKASVGSLGSVRANDEKITALMAACCNGRKVMVEWLLKSVTPFVVNVHSGSKRNTALHLVIGSAFRNSSVSFPLHKACLESDITSVNALIFNNELAVNEQDNFGKTPLHYACAVGSSAIANELLLAGARDDIIDDNGHVAVSYMLNERDEFGTSTLPKFDIQTVDKILLSFHTDASVYNTIDKRFENNDQASNKVKSLLTDVIQLMPKENNSSKANMIVMIVPHHVSKPPAASLSDENRTSITAYYSGPESFASLNHGKGIIRAIQLGQTESVRVLLKNSSQYFNDAQLLNSLYTAARLGQTEICRLIVNTKSVNSNHISNALILACTNGHLAAAQFLFQHCKCGHKRLTEALVSVTIRAKIEVGDWLANEVLHFEVGYSYYWLLIISCVFGSVANIKSFLNDTVPFYEIDPKEFSSRALRVACWTGRLKVVNYLLDNTPADIAFKGPVRTRGDRITALMAACRGKRNKSLLRQLLQRVTPYVINISSDISESTVLHMAIWSADDSARDFPLHKACLEGDVRTVRRLLYVCDVNAPDMKGRTPLHYACTVGCVETVMLLLSVDARTDIADNHGHTPAALADASGNGELAEFIISMLHMTGQGSSAAQLNLPRDKILLSYHETLDDYYPAFNDVDDSLFNSKPIVEKLPPRTSNEHPRGTVAILTPSVRCTCGRCQLHGTNSGNSYESCVFYLAAINYPIPPTGSIRNFYCERVCKTLHMCIVCNCGCELQMAPPHLLQQIDSAYPADSSALLVHHRNTGRHPVAEVESTSNLTKEQEAMIKKEIARRTKDLDKQLAASGFQAVDVAGDGNCFFRAACILLDGNELGHLKLRERVASHVERQGHLLDGVVETSPDDGHALTGHVQTLRTPNTPVGEDAIMALASIYNRPVIVYSAFVEPLVYQPADDTQLNSGRPLRLAFFEPGHYMAVMTRAEARRVGATSADKSPTDNIQNIITNKVPDHILNRVSSSPVVNEASFVKAGGKSLKASGRSSTGPRLV